MGSHLAKLVKRLLKGIIMKKEAKISLLEEMMELESGTLCEGTSLEELEEWNSLAAISLIVLVSEQCGKTLTAEEIKSFKTVSDILDYMD